MGIVSMMTEGQPVQRDGIGHVRASWMGAHQLVEHHKYNINHGMARDQ